MDDLTDITKGSNDPIPVPSVDTAWNDMRRRLEDEMPQGAGLPLNNAEGAGRSFKRIALPLVLFCLLLAGGLYFTLYEHNRDGNSKEISGTVPGSGKRESDPQGPQQEKSKKEIQKLTGLTKKTEHPVPPAHLTISDPPTAPASGRPARIHENEINSNRETWKKQRTTQKRRVAAPEPGEPGNTRQERSIENWGRNQQLQVGIDSSNSQADAPAKQTAAPAETVNGIKKGQGPDSLAANLEKPAEDSRWKWMAGLSWTLQVPTTSVKGFFTGPDTKSRPYRLILPGVYFQAQHEKHQMSAELNPFLSNLVPSRPFRTNTETEVFPDTTVVKEQSRSLRKLFGASFGFGYANNVTGRWWIGGHVQFAWWRKAIATATGDIKKYPSNGSSPVVFPFSETYRLDNEWSNFSRNQLFLSGDAFYNAKKWQAGIRAGYGFTPLSKNDGPSHPFRLELMYRLKLFDFDDEKQMGYWIR